MLGSNVVMKPSDPLSIFTNPSSGLHWEVVCEREKVTTKSGSTTNLMETVNLRVCLQRVFSPYY